MVKGITSVAAIATDEGFARLGSLLRALGFEVGKGWEDGSGKGAAFLAPMGNIELVTGRMPAEPSLLIEVTQLDAVYKAVQEWVAAAGGVGPSEVGTRGCFRWSWQRDCKWDFGSPRMRCMGGRLLWKAIFRLRGSGLRLWWRGGMR